MRTLRFVRALILAAIPAALAAQTAPAPRGMGYTMVMTTDSGGGHKTTMSMLTEILGSKYRMAMKTDAIGGAPTEMYMVIDSLEGTMMNVMPAQSMAMVMPTSMLKQAALPPYKMEMGPNPIVSVADMGAGEKILGHTTRHFRQILTYSIKITVGDETCMKPSREVSDVWTTTEVSLPNIMGAVLRFTGAKSPDGFAEKLDSLQNKTVKGMTLRRISTVTTTSPSGDTLRVTTTMEMAALKSDAVDPADFEVPAGYNVMDMRAMMGNIDPSTMQEAMSGVQSKIAESLKKSLCGGSDTRKP
jgi:hypothetical protein